MAHDIGHPPFGHGGEVALNYMMRNLEEGGGGFEGNAQSLRIVSRLEPRIQDHGLDLTRRTLLGILKYPIRHSELLKAGGCQRDTEGLGNFRTVDPEDWKPPKCYFDEEAGLVDWILSPFPQGDYERLGETDSRSSLKPLHKSLDSTIMEIADDIGYGIHDFEDAIHMGFIASEDLEDSGIFQRMRDSDPDWLQRYGLTDLEDRLFRGDKSEIKQTIGALVNACIASTKLKEYEGFDHPLLRFRAKLDAEVEQLIKGFKELVLKRVIESPEVQSFEYKGQQIIMEVFEALHGNPERLLPRDIQERLEQGGESPERIICDYIAGMTDEYATKIYERLFMPRQGSLFQKI